MALLPEQLGDEHLTLRAMSLEYLTSAFDAVLESRPEVRRWLWWAQDPLDEVSYREFVGSQREKFDHDAEWRYFIFEDQSGELVGGASVDWSESNGLRAANVGYWIRSSRTGRGLATRAAGILTDAAFSYLSDVAVVEIGMDVANTASARVAEKLGFTRGAELDKAIRAPGHTGRGVIWMMRRGDWYHRESASSS